MAQRHRFVIRHPVFIGRSFLPARRTDPYCIHTDVDRVHQDLWASRNVRNNLVERPRLDDHDSSRYLVRLMVAQGRIRVPQRAARLVEVKDPDVWASEAKDFRKGRQRKGRIRCQFCGLDYENHKKRLIVCPMCCQRLGLLQLRRDVYDEKRNVKPEWKQGASR